MHSPRIVKLVALGAIANLQATNRPETIKVVSFITISVYGCISKETIIVSRGGN
jgi:hypothetical protein